MTTSTETEQLVLAKKRRRLSTRPPREAVQLGGGYLDHPELLRKQRHRPQRCIDELIDTTAAVPPVPVSRLPQPQSKGQTMATTSNPAAVQTFMVIATMRDNTNLADLAALRADEEKQLEVLHSDGRIGAHHVAPARRTVFLEVIAADEKQVVETLATLPYNKFFDPDVYPITAPDVADTALRTQS